MATGLAGTAKFRLEAEEAACKCPTVTADLLLSLTNWRAKSKYDRLELTSGSSLSGSREGTSHGAY